MRGFSLLELLCALAIVGILSSIAIPSYQNYLHQTYREQAKAKLVDMAAALSQQRLSTSSRAFPDDVEGKTNTSSTDYMFSLIVADNGVDYLLRATPLSQGRQVGDGILSLASTGLGCWYAGRDNAQEPDCSGNDDHTW